LLIILVHLMELFLQAMEGDDGVDVCNLDKYLMFYLDETANMDIHTIPYSNCCSAAMTAKLLTILSVILYYSYLLLTFFDVHKQLPTMASLLKSHWLTIH
jgi:hypothetical protein